MTLSQAAIDGLFAFSAPQPEYPTARTVSGFEGARIVVTGTGRSGHPFGPGLLGFMTTAQPVTTVIVTSAMPDYDAVFVKAILAADSSEPEASFDNVIDMLEWLNRE